MSLEELQKWINENLVGKRGINSSMLRNLEKNNKKIYDEIYEYTKILDYDKYPLTARVKLLKDKKTEPDRCVCGNYISYTIKANEWAKTCGYSCSNKITANKKEIKEKIKQTNIEKYGVECVFQSENIKEKIKQTNIEKYGVENNGYLRKVNISFEDLYELYINQKLSYEECAKYFNVTAMVIWKRIYEYNIPVRYDFRQSSEERKIHNILEENNIFFEKNKKGIIKGKLELDVFIPQKSVAVEINGGFYHKEDFTDKLYHIKKTNMCKEKGINLIHFWDHEINNKFEICKSILLTKLNVYEKKLFARECFVKELNDNNIVKNFLNNNHIQGYSLSSVKLGLFYHDELVSIMTFSKPRFNKKYEWELNRYCSIINYSVVGGASKLFKYFLKFYNPKTIISYCDIRIFLGQIYNRLGFEFLYNTSPNYNYHRGNEIYSRLKFQKHKLKDLLEDYNDKLSEKENMNNNGYIRIWDCGNSVWGWKQK